MKRLAIVLSMMVGILLLVGIGQLAAGVGDGDGLGETAVSQPSNTILPQQLAAPALNGAPEACAGTNLLSNPGFEGDYSSYIYPDGGHPDCGGTTCERAQMPADWHPRWSTSPRTETWMNIMPEYTQSTPDQVNPDRVLAGDKSLHYFSFWSTHEGVVFQQVAAIPGGSYCFSAHGHAWSNRVSGNSNDGFLSAELDSINDGRLYQRVGIDPTGGTDWTADSVIWSDERRQYDLFEPFRVEATATASQITVFIYSRADAPVKHNDVYWDEAALTLNEFFGVSPNGISEMVDVDLPTMVTRTVSISATSTVTWTAVLEAGGTLTPTLSTGSGMGSGTVQVSIDTAGLVIGTYSVNLRLDAGDTVGSPVTVPIRLYVVPEVRRLFLPSVLRE